MPVVDVEGFENCICHHTELVNLYGCIIGKDTKIGAFVEIGRNVKIGERCKIQTGVYIPEGVIIGDDVFIGPNTTFTNVLFPMTGEQYKKTIVHSKAVIGAGVTVLPGVLIGYKSVVGAGSVVVEDVKPNTTVKGFPAK